jgi:hypothetical protein
MNAAHVYLQAIAPIPPVPSRVCEYKGTLTTTTNEDTTTWTDVDIGTPHPKRVVVLMAYAGAAAATSTGSINGIPLTAEGASSVFVVGSALVPNGTTATLVLTTASSLRKAVSVYVLYPENHARIDRLTDTASGTTDAVLPNLDVVAGGTLIYAGGQNAVLGTFTTTWSGTDAVTEDVDAQLEGVASYTMGHISPISVSSNEDDLTLAESASGAKAFIAITYGPPPLRSN